jgi:hypothetical protein
MAQLHENFTPALSEQLYPLPATLCGFMTAARSDCGCKGVSLYRLYVIAHSLPQLCCGQIFFALSETEVMAYLTAWLTTNGMYPICRILQSRYLACFLFQGTIALSAKKSSLHI